MANVMTELEILNAAMQVGWVRFSYFKEDGSKRIAIGTRNKALIESILHRKLVERQSYYHHCNGYFDLVRVDWRQFNTDRFIGIEFERMSNEQAIKESVIIAMSEDAQPHMINKIENAGNNICKGTTAHTIVMDSMRVWCENHNNGRGLNGVLCRAGDHGGSGCLGWPSAPMSVKSTTKVSQSMPKVSADGFEEFAEEHFNASNPEKNRAALIAELMDLRKRESEILAELLS